MADHEQVDSESDLNCSYLSIKYFNIICELSRSETEGSIIDLSSETDLEDEEENDVQEAEVPSLEPDAPVEVPAEQEQSTQEIELVERISRCKHHMCFDSMNLKEVLDTMYREMDFRMWFQHGSTKMSRDELMNYLWVNKRTINSNMFWYLKKQTSSAIHANPSYEMLVTRFYSKLKIVSVTPFQNSWVDIVMHRGDEYDDNACYMTLCLYGIQGRFLFEVNRLNNEYLVNAHPRSLMNISCPFKALGFVKYMVTGSIFLLAQMGGQPLLISLFPTNDYGYDSTFIDDNQ